LWGKGELLKWRGTRQGFQKTGTPINEEGEGRNLGKKRAKVNTKLKNVKHGGGGKRSKEELK